MATVQEIRVSRRWAALVSAGIGSVLLALAWNRLANPLAVIGFQSGLLEGLGGSGVVLALGLSFLVGVSMIFVPCTFPLVFALSPLAEEAETRRGWAVAVGLFTLGLATSMGAVGAVAGLGGAAVLPAIPSAQARMAAAIAIYTAVGIFALAYAIHEFGFVRLPGLPQAWLPGWARSLGRWRRSLVLGAVLGGGLGVGCPAPTYYAVLLFAAASADPLLGAALLVANALGRVAPVVLIGSLFFAGAAPGTVSRWVAERRGAMKLANGVALTLLGGFLLSYWTIGVGLGIL